MASTATNDDLKSITAVNPDYERPSDLHPAEIGPAFPGNPFDETNRFFDQYSWNTVTEGFSTSNIFAVVFFGLLILTIISLFLRKDSLNFLTFYVYQKHHKRIDVKLSGREA